MSPGSPAKLAPFISALRAKWNLIGSSLFEGSRCTSVVFLAVVHGQVAEAKQCLGKEVLLMVRTF